MGWARAQRRGNVVRHGSAPAVSRVPACRPNGRYFGPSTALAGRPPRLAVEAAGKRQLRGLGTGAGWALCWRGERGAHAWHRQLRCSLQVFSQIRNEHFSSVFGFLSQKSRNLQAQYDVSVGPARGTAAVLSLPAGSPPRTLLPQRRRGMDIKQMKNFVSQELKGLKQEHRLLSLRRSRGWDTGRVPAAGAWALGTRGGFEGSPGWAGGLSGRQGSRGCDFVQVPIAGWGDELRAEPVTPPKRPSLLAVQISVPASPL